MGDSLEITANVAVQSSTSVLTGVSRSRSNTIEGNLVLVSSMPIHHFESNLAVANDGAQPEILNKRALAIVSRLRDKLTGKDFPNETEETLSIQRQVELHLQQATSHEDLCQCYIDW